MQTLYDRIKPELLGKLLQNRKKYEYTVNKCITLLENNYRYGDLTVDDVNTISTFCEAPLFEVSVFEYRHGSFLFNEPKSNDNE